jgi:hypothetical protein
MARVCANCGTEVDDEALFCPTCGEPIEANAEPELPPAPDWPEQAGPALATGAVVGEVTPNEAPTVAAPRATSAPEPSPVTMDDEAPMVPDERFEETATPATEPVREVPPWRRGATHRASEPGSPPTDQGEADRPGALRPPGILTLPETLSGWLVGIGAIIGVVAMLLPWVVAGTYIGSWGLASGVNLLLTVLLLAVLAVVFVPNALPPIPQRNLALLAIALIGIGVGLDRLGLPLTGSGAVVFLIGMLASAAGALLAQLGVDRRVGGAGS